MFSNFDPTMLFAIAGGIFVKLATSPKMSWLRMLLSSLIAAIMAWDFSSPTVRLLNLDPAIFSVPITIAWVFTGEGVARWLIGLGASPEKLVDFVMRLRSGK